MLADTVMTVSMYAVALVGTGLALWAALHAYALWTIRPRSAGRALADGKDARAPRSTWRVDHDLVADSAAHQCTTHG
jgi:hypothetical protein